MHSEKIFFTNSRGQKICGILEKPTPEMKRVVIIVHGYATHKNRTSSTLMVEELVRRGIHSLRIDLNGCGESEGDFEKQTITSTVDDTTAAIKYCEQLGYTDIELFGASAGGLTVMATALTNPQIKKIGLKCPVSDYISLYQSRLGESGIQAWKQTASTPYSTSEGKIYNIDYSVFEDTQNYVMYDKVKDIACPVLIVHGDADETVPIEQSKKLTVCFPNAQLVIVPGADHKFTKTEHSTTMNQLFGDWFEV